MPCRACRKRTTAFENARLTDARRRGAKTDRVRSRLWRLQVGAFAPRVWYSGLRYCMPAGSAALQWYVNRAPLVGDQKSAALQIAHAGSRTRVTSMGGLYDAATLRAPHLFCSSLLHKWAARWRCQRAANTKEKERERETETPPKLARANA